MIATKRRCPPLRAAGIGANSNHWQHDTSASPLAQAKQRVTVFDLWRHFRFPGDPKRHNPVRSPFRQDHKPSFSITRDGKLFHDFADADHRGDVVDFWRLATGLPVADACSAFIQFAGTGCSGIIPITRSAPAPASPPAERQKPVLPPMQRGDHKRLQVLAQFRNLSVEGLQLASERGLLWFAMVHGLSAWLATDATGWNCQARRLDGGLWTHLAAPAKAYSLPGCRAAWPIGITEAQSFPVVALVEGTPDLLAAHHFTHAEGRERDVAAVCITGAANSIPDDALPSFAGRRVRIFPHLDDAGQKAAQRWTAQLESVNATVDCFDLGGITRTSGQPVKDLNDLASLDADKFETDHDLWSIFP
jgi:hypothetical protein